MDGFPERLAEALAHRQVSRPQVSAALGVTQSAVGHWLNDRRAPDLDALAALATFLRVRAAWLAFGDGPMVEAPAAPVAPPRKASGTTPAVRARKAS